MLPRNKVRMVSHHLQCQSDTGQAAPLWAVTGPPVLTFCVGVPLGFQRSRS